MIKHKEPTLGSYSCLQILFSTSQLISYRLLIMLLYLLTFAFRICFNIFQISHTMHYELLFFYFNVPHLNFSYVTPPLINLYSYANLQVLIKKKKYLNLDEKVTSKKISNFQGYILTFQTALKIKLLTMEEEYYDYCYVLKSRDCSILNLAQIATILLRSTQ